MVRAIVGANWGDEGKGKITDMLAKESDIIIRFQGGSKRRSYDYQQLWPISHFTLLPSGVFYGHTTSIIGNGVALNIPVSGKRAGKPGISGCSDADIFWYRIAHRS